MSQDLNAPGRRFLAPIRLKAQEMDACEDQLAHTRCCGMRCVMPSRVEQGESSTRDDILLRPDHEAGLLRGGHW
jgi:hypothetical protein